MSKLYTLYYKADVLMDVYTLLPQRAGVYSEEGQRHQMKVTTFDNAARKATFENVTAKNGRREFQCPAFTQDALSAVYVIRALPLKVGGRETIPVSTGGHAYHAQVSVEGTEALKTPAGPYQAFRLRTTLSGRRPPERPPHQSVDQRYAKPRARETSVRSRGGSFNLTLREARPGIEDRRSTMVYASSGSPSACRTFAFTISPPRVISVSRVISCCIRLSRRHP